MNTYILLFQKALQGTNLKFVYGFLLCFLFVKGSKPIRFCVGSQMKKLIAENVPVGSAVGEEIRYSE